MKKELFVAGIIFIILISGFAVCAEDQTLKKIDANKILAKDVEIPENIWPTVKFVFGLNESEKLNFEELVIIVALWIFMFFLILSLIKFIPFFEESNQLICLTLSFIIMMLISISRGLYNGALILLNLANFFSFKSRIISIFTTLIIIFIIGFGFTRLIAILKARVKNAEESGMMRRLSFWTDILRGKRKTIS